MSPTSGHILFFTLLKLFHTSNSNLNTLPEIIESFHPCLVILIDFLGTNVSSVSVPTLRISPRGPKLPNEQVLAIYGPDRFSHTYYLRTFNSNHLKIQKNLYCFVEFHLHPPIDKGRIDFGYQLESLVEFLTERKLQTGNLDFDQRTGYQISANYLYRILITTVLTGKTDWTRWLESSFFAKRYYVQAPSNLMVMLFNGTLSKIYLVCDVCIPCSIKYVRYDHGNSNSTFAISKLRSIFDALTAPVFSRMWRVANMGTRLDQISTYDDEISVAIEREGKHLFTAPYFTSFAPDTTIKLDFILFRLALNNATMAASEKNCSLVSPGDLLDDPKSGIFYVQHYLKVWDFNLGTTSNGPHVVMDLFGSHFLNIKEEGLEFVTCFQKGSFWSVNFGRLLRPLDNTTWTMLLIFGKIICVIVTLGSYLLIIEEDHNFYPPKSTVFVNNVIHLAYGTLMEQSNAYSRNALKYSEINLKFPYILCSIWILGAIVLSNCYKGEYVKSLTVPPEHPKFSLFEDLIHSGFTFLTTPYDISVYLDVMRSKNNTNMTSFYYIDYEKYLSVIYLFQFFILKSKDAIENPNAERYQTLQKLVNTSSIPAGYTNVVHGKQAFSSLISNCDEKIALASWSDDIDLTFYELKAKLPNSAVISKSVKPFARIAKGWAIYNWGPDQVLQRIGALLTCSGLAEKWYKVVKGMTHEKFIKEAETMKGGWKRLDFKGNFFGIFAIWGCGLGATWIMFGYERFKLTRIYDWKE
ncbi:hypothetical protein Fcan01_15606 [Folsomia candida]|uniref:Uncharacterized protein n=1 Tax=Folsomia candida TaxID=158441 RepID=A0A226DWY5_FOLCA|nr:hypothetical protein Fcan01_15606 [Folsomia candida]